MKLVTILFFFITTLNMNCKITSKLEFIKMIVLNPSYPSFYKFPEKDLINGSNALSFFANTFYNENINKKIVSNKFQISYIGNSQLGLICQNDTNVINLFEKELFSNYLYRAKDFKNNTAFILIILFWSESTTYLTIDTEYKMHYNGKHIDYKIDLIRAILPYIDKKILSDVKTFLPLYSKGPNNPQKELK